MISLGETRRLGGWKQVTGGEVPERERFESCSVKYSSRDLRRKTGCGGKTGKGANYIEGETPSEGINVPMAAYRRQV